MFLRLIWRQSVRKKVNNICRLSSFYRSNHRSCSAKQVFLKILQNSQESTCVGVSLRTFKSAILSKRDSNANVFLWILRNFEEHFRTTAFYFMKKNRHNWRLNNSSKKILNQWKYINLQFCKMTCLQTEAATEGVLLEKMFLKISRNSQENS